MDVTLAILVKCGAVQMTGSPVASTEVDGISESPDAVASAVALALWSELLNPVVVEVSNVELTVIVYGETPGAIELSLAHALGAEGLDERAVILEHPDLMAPAIADVDSAVGGDGDSGGAIGLCITLLESTE